MIAGAETKHFHVRDGLAFSLWHQAGKRSAILSGRRTAAVDHRAAELRIPHVIQGAAEKAGPFRACSTELGLAPRQVCFIGDDLPDLPVLRPSGWPRARPTPPMRSVTPLISSPTRLEAAAPSERSSRSS